MPALHPANACPPPGAASAPDSTSTAKAPQRELLRSLYEAAVRSAQPLHSWARTCPRRRPAGARW